jgi:hypothetical protein
VTAATVARPPRTRRRPGQRLKLDRQVQKDVSPRARRGETRVGATKNVKRATVLLASPTARRRVLKETRVRRSGSVSGSRMETNPYVAADAASLVSAAFPERRLEHSRGSVFAFSTGMHRLELPPGEQVALAVTGRLGKSLSHALEMHRFGRTRVGKPAKLRSRSKRAGRLRDHHARRQDESSRSVS